MKIELLRNILKPINVNLYFQMKHISTFKKSYREVQVPISSGFIAGKWWGPLNKRPILALHGYQDNAGTYDRLTPLLSENIPILAIDLPGNGFSYRLPPGLTYHDIDSIIVAKQIKNYFGWDKISLMGHSMGAILVFTYGFLFPNDVDFMVCMDGLQPLLHPKKMDRISTSINELIKYDNLNNTKKEPPSYTIQEMKQRLYDNYDESIDFETTTHILYRNIAPSKNYPGKFYFNRDARLKVGRLVVYDPNEILRVAEKVTFPILVTKAYESGFWGNQTMYEETLEILQKINKGYEFHNVYGGHHAHLNNPENLAPLINNFIKKYDKENRSTDGLKVDIIIDENMYPISKYKNKIFIHE